MTYRPDIDGLRAIAVLAVVIFHLGIPGFGGGYVGVDVFFVISGFLISSIIKGKLEQREFRLRGFYGRRIRRLVPPLIVTVAATLLGAGLLLTPYDMIGFARSAVAALFSLSNFVFFMEAGYWDTASELKPLLHTWSLGVEEQFYLFWPALMMLIVAARSWLSFTAAMLAITAGGFGLCVWYTGLDQAAAFYLLPFRVFQFSMGALVIPLIDVIAAQPGGKKQSIASALLAAGLMLIALSVALLADGSRFPGWWVLLPTSGAALCLLAGGLREQNQGGLFCVLDNRVSLWLGRVSYSLYLVHWPIVSLYRYENGLHLGVLEQVALAIVTLLATCVLHYGVERRFYQRAGYERGEGAGISNIVAVTGIGASAIAVATVSATAWLGDGWMWRMPDLAHGADDIKAGMNRRYTLYRNGCTLDAIQRGAACGSAETPLVLVIGNSHEPDGFNIMHAVLEGVDSVELVAFGNTNEKYCGSITVSDANIRSSNPVCQKRLDLLFSDAIVERLNAVVYSSNRPFAHNKQPALEILQALKAAKPTLKTITLGGYINTRRDCSHYIALSGSTAPCAEARNVSYFAAEPSTEPLYAGFMSVTDYYVDKVDLLCEDRVLESCATETEGGVPVFYDVHHLSLEFAQMLGKQLLNRDPQILELLVQE